MNIFLILSLLFLLLTVVVLFTGMATMTKGGDFNKKYGNKLMQARVACQALALLFFILSLLT